MRPLFTAREVRQILSVSTATLYRLHDADILRAVEIVHGKRKRLLRWRPEALEKFVASREKLIKAKRVSADLNKIVDEEAMGNGRAS